MVRNHWRIAGCAGVIAAPITSGDTALRSARLIVADFMHLEQKSITRRLLICIPIFAVTIGILLYSQRDAAGFDMIWRYFAWCNQTLSVFTLWAITVYLVRMKKNYYVTLLPALFMTKRFVHNCKGMNQTVVHNSNSILLLREGGVVEDRGGRKNNVYTYFFVNDRIMYSPTTSPYGYSSFPKEEN